MRQTPACLLLFVLSLPMACDTTDKDDSGTSDVSPDGTRTGCAGSYSGTYDGTDSGTVAAVLAGSDLVITFVSDGGGGIEGTATVDEAGGVSGESQGVQIEGTFEFTGCTAAGSWSGGGAGTWRLAPG